MTYTESIRERQRNAEACRRAVMHQLERADHGLSNLELACCTGYDKSSVANALYKLSCDGLVRREVEALKGMRGAKWVRATSPQPVRRLVGHMLPEEGNRFEACSRYDQCLTAISKQSPKAGRCPTECTSFVARDLRADLNEIAAHRAPMDW